MLNFYNSYIPCFMLALVLAVGITFIDVLALISMSLINHGSRREVLNLLLTHILPFFLLLVLYLSPWSYVVRETGLPLLWLICTIEFFAGCLYNHWSKNREEGSAWPTLAYFIFLIVTCSISAYYTSKALSFNTGANFDYIAFTLLLVGLMVLAWFVAKYGMSLWHAHIHMHNSLISNFEAKAEQIKQNRIAKAEQIKQNRMNKAEQIRQDRINKAEQLKQDRINREEQIKQDHINKDASKNEARIEEKRMQNKQRAIEHIVEKVLSRYNLDPKSYSPQIRSDVKLQSDLLTDEDLSILATAIAKLEELWKSQRRNIGYYLSNRDIIFEQLTQHRAVMNDYEKKTVLDRVGMLIMLLFGDPSDDEPKTSLEAAQRVIKHYHTTFPGPIVHTDKYDLMVNKTNNRLGKFAHSFSRSDN